MSSSPSAPVLAVLSDAPSGGAAGAAGDTARVLPLDTPLLRADDLGVLRGEGVFETARAVAGRPFLLDAHLRRMARSAERVQLTLPSPEQLTALATTALDAFGPDEASLRLVATKGPDGAGIGRVFALVSPVGAAAVRAREEGIAAVTLTLGVTADVRLDAPWLLGGVKSTSYAVAMAALRAATEAGGGDAVYLSTDGEVLEAPTASVVVVVDGRPVTPPEQAVGLLPGTTVGFFGASIERRRITEDELRTSPEVLLLSSVRGVVPVLELDGRPVGAGTVGPHGSRMRDAYEAAARALAHEAN